MADTIKELQERIKRLEDENRRWMRLAGTNRLTDLPNSLMFYKVVLPGELRKYDKMSVSLACLLIAPDKLGDVNQELGRAIGDQLIQEVANFLKERIEEEERLFHLDGANFAILMMGAAEGRAKRKATGIRLEFQEATLEAGEKEFPDLTCSIGLAMVEGVIEAAEVTETVDVLYREVSDRLYNAKKGGGNAIVGVI